MYIEYFGIKIGESYLRNCIPVNFVSQKFQVVAPRKKANASCHQITAMTANDLPILFTTIYKNKKSV